MRGFEHHRLLIVGLAVVPALLTVCAGWMISQRSRALEALERLDGRRQQWRAIAQSSPPPVPDVAEHLEAEGARAARLIDTLQTSFRAGPSTGRAPGNVPPLDRARAFFRISEFVASGRAELREVGIAVRDGETFGFGSYERSGPAEEDIAEVHRQCVLVADVIAALAQARPMELQSIARERLHPGLGSGGAATDFFELAPLTSLRRTGLLETRALQVTFSGPTSALRGFLSALASQDRVFAVRDVAVEPLATEIEPPPASRSILKDSEARPFVVSHPSRFVVTLEAIDLASKASPQTTGPRTTGPKDLLKSPGRLRRRQRRVNLICSQRVSGFKDSSAVTGSGDPS